MIMYHGTNKINSKKILKEGFIPSKSGTLGAGIYLTR